jgi:hypothetical protein
VEAAWKQRFNLQAEECRSPTPYWWNSAKCSESHLVQPRQMPYRVSLGLSVPKPHSGLFEWSFCFWKPYKLRSVHALKPNNRSKRCEFCREFQDKLEEGGMGRTSLVSVARQFLVEGHIQSLQPSCLEFYKASPRRWLWTTFPKLKKLCAIPYVKSFSPLCFAVKSLRGNMGMLMN